MGTLYSNRYDKDLTNYILAGYNDLFDESKYFRLNYNLVDNKKFTYPTYKSMNIDNLLYKYHYTNYIRYYFKTEEDMVLFKLKYNI